LKTQRFNSSASAPAGRGQSARTMELQYLLQQSVTSVLFATTVP
jgi:hypothetical protein